MTNDSASDRPEDLPSPSPDGKRDDPSSQDVGDVSPRSPLNQRRVCYEQAVRTAIAHQFPLGEEDLWSLRRLQQELQVPDDIAQATSRHIVSLAAEEEARYQELLQRYEVEFQAVLEKKRMVSDADRRQLTQRLSQWGIASSDAALIEQQVRARFQASQASARVSSDSPAAARKSFRAAEATRLEALGLPAPLGVQSELPAPNLSPPNLPPSDPSPLSSPSAHPSTGAPVQDAVVQDAVVQDAVGQESSDRGSAPDYSTLESLLQSGAWQQADHETYRCLLQACDRLGEGWLDRSSLLELLPDADLQLIDRLWQTHSDGHFGFSVQRDIFLELVAADPAYRASPARFSQQIGWMLWDKPFLGFKYYRQLTFSLESPKGHLPAKWFWEIPWQQALRCGGLGVGRGGCGKDGGMLSALYDIRLAGVPSLQPMESSGFPDQPSQ